MEILLAEVLDTLPFVPQSSIAVFSKCQILELLPGAPPISPINIEVHPLNPKP